MFSSKARLRTHWELTSEVGGLIGGWGVRGLANMAYTSGKLLGSFRGDRSHEHQHGHGHAHDRE